MTAGEAGSGSATRVFVIDDHAVVRRGLRQILEESPEATLAGEAGSGAEALTRLRQTHCDVVVLDISLPDCNGLDLLRQIRSQHPRLAVLILTMHAEEPYAVRALRAGAAGYLTKDGAAEELLAAIRKVAAGGRYLSSALAETLAVRIGAGTRELPHERLSDREFQVLCLMATGQSLTEIANTLGVSVKTVSTHRARMLEKMHLRNNAELIQYAVRHDLVA
ncbi:MAG: response regulator transcription factor [Vicinamibacteria bacterium]|nr:response regulator transcription factor [Vicinamibacteria bacterium]